ncbi:V-type proton ATPase subunit S1 [Oryzias latipes]|uniref:V-type proton ATPase subunit S1 n=1 Tax=Oryzias latipes TaxID=8090 RepID=UPI0005CC8053|nr:V-type proton ATPase subunit S1 [Oryzias latipes]
MASPWKCLCMLLLHLQPSSCLHLPAADSFVSPVDGGRLSALMEDDALHHIWSSSVLPRKLLQMSGAAAPLSPLKIFSNGEPCVLFQARKLSLRYEKHKQLDLTERAFSSQKPVDVSRSVCRQDKATLVMAFGDVEGLRDLSIRLQLSNTFYESSGQWWFSVDSVLLIYNSSEEALFNASDVYAPASSSYRCPHVSSLQRYSGLLLPSTDHARRWSITFIDFQIQAFNVSSGRFSPASDCTTILTPAILMGLISSLILLLVLAYALHMVIHLKHIEHDDNHKADMYFPQSTEQLEHCCDENTTEKNAI